jgi:hypothetical protein
MGDMSDMDAAIAVDFWNTLHGQQPCRPSRPSRQLGRRAEFFIALTATKDLDVALAFGRSY